LIKFSEIDGSKLQPVHILAVELQPSGRINVLGRSVKVEKEKKNIAFLKPERWPCHGEYNKDDHILFIRRLH
jgi:hypothetical protein